MGLSSPQTPSYPGSSSVASNGTTLHRASRCRMASSRASSAACVTSASMSAGPQTSPRRATSSKNGGTTTTPTDRTRASTGSHQPSSQHAPSRGKTGTDSPYERGQIGEQVTVICPTEAEARGWYDLLRDDLAAYHRPALLSHRDDLTRRVDIHFTEVRETKG